jgi:hypothetical protein
LPSNTVLSFWSSASITYSMACYTV